MASKTLTAKVKLDITDAQSKLKRLENLLKNIDRAANGKSKGGGLEKSLQKQVIAAEKVKQATLKTQLAEQKLTAQKHKTALAAQKLNSANEKAAQSAKQMATAYRSGNSAAGGLLRTVKSLASTYLGIMGAKAVIGASDTITSAENRLNNLEGGSPELTAQSMDKIYAASMRARTGYGDMLSNVSKSMTLAGDAFQGNIDNAIRFQEIMSKAYTVGGASAAEQASSMYQLVQALGSGVLQGDELRSVREGAPLAYKAIEEFAQGVFKTDESLKELASQGLITSDMIVAAIMDMENGVDNINDKFENTAMTFAQAWEMIKNMALQAFKPVLQMLNDFLNSDAGQAFIVGIGNALVWVANTVMWLWNSVLYPFISWCVENWDWLKHIVVAALLAMIGHMLYQATIAVWTAIMNIMAMSKVQWAIIGIIAAIMALVYIFYLWKTAAIDTCQAIALALLVIAVVCFFIFGWVVALVIAAIALAVMFFDVVSGIVLALGAVIIDIILIVWNIIVAVVNFIVALISFAGATAYNLFVSCFNAMMQALYAIFVDPIAGIIEWFVNAFSGGFDGILGAAANALGQLVSMFLSGLKVITNAVDAVAGTELSAKISGWQDSAKNWGKKSTGVTYKVEAPKLDRVDATAAFSNGMSTFGYASLINPLDAYSTGSEWGSGVMDSVNNWGSQFQNSGSGSKNPMEAINNKLNLTDGIGNNLTGSSGLLDPNDPAHSLGGAYDPSAINDDIANANKKLGNIDDSTGSMADSMELAEEDLEYLRKLADMEWKKEYTTANITVDMSNYNTINGESDLDGLVTKLSEKLTEELNVVANGVYV